MKTKYNFNKHFGVKDKTPEHLNILLESDIEVFIDPFLIGNTKSNPFAKRIYERSKLFLEKLNRDYVVTGDRDNGIKFLSDLHEANEYGLGYSYTNKGKGIGPGKAEVIYDSLYNNKLARSGTTVTNEADNVLLLVEGIGQDNMSDTLANVCRDIFAEFTLKQCNKYDIPTDFKSIRFFNELTGKWEKKRVQLPFFNGDHIILVPKFISSGKREYQNRYNWYVSSNYISKDILNGKIKIKDDSPYIFKKKDGSSKAVIKAINKDFSKPKAKLIEHLIDYPKSLIGFKDYAKLYYLCYKE